MVNPVELLGSARRRLALVAATSVLVYTLAPAITAFVLALAIAPLNSRTGLELGYELLPSVLAGLRAVLVATGLIELALCAALYLRQSRRTGGLVDAAERVDSILGARQEIVTFATLTDASRLDARNQRTQLFPILWRRTAEYMAQFDPARIFPLQLGEPLKRGSLLSLATLIVFALAMMALVRPPSPETAQANRIRGIAREIARSSPDSAGQALAKALTDTAAALENPKLPPEQKLAMLAEVMREVEQMKANPPPSASGNQSGKGNSTGKGDSGKGEGQGSGAGTGSGKGNNAEAKGGNNGNKGPQQIAELEKELSKAKEHIENQSAPKDNSIPKPAPGEQPGNMLKPGENPNQPGSANQPEANGANKMPKPGESGSGKKAGEGAKQNAGNDKGSTQGDTHLGQFPAPVRYERFYKLGEKGEPIEIRDARYVVFRLPAESVGGGGKTVLSSVRPTAGTPYSNLPLKAERLQVTPDERQQVPPRYRDLIQ